MFDQSGIRRPLASFSFSWFLTLLASGCGDAGNEPGNGDEIEVQGTWLSSFDTTETISSDAWNTQEIVLFDNAENLAVTQNTADAEFDPGKFNKNVWTEPEAGSFHYCTVAFGVDTAALAEAAANTANATDPESGGCGDFSWTQLTRIEP